MLLLAVVVKHGVILGKESILGHNLSSEEVWQDRIHCQNHWRKRRLEMSVCNGILLARESATGNVAFLVRVLLCNRHTSVALARSVSAFASAALSLSDRLVFFRPLSTRP